MEKPKKSTLKTKYILLFIVPLLVLAMMTNIAYAADEEDELNDVYETSLLDFLYVMGDHMGDPPESIDEIEDIAAQLIGRSQMVPTPDGIDIDEINFGESSGNTTVEIVMQDDIKDLDFVVIWGIFERSGELVCSFQINWDGGSEDFEWTDEDENNDTTGDISGETATIDIPESVYDYRDSDKMFIFALTVEGDFEDALSSRVYFDIFPNSIGDDISGAYTGPDPITSFIDSVADFLFGWLLPRSMTFPFFIALLIVIGQILFDRKSRWLHYTGMIGLLLLLYPIIMFSLNIQIVGVLGLPNIFGIMEVMIMFWFSMFIVMTVLANKFNLFKKYLWPFVAGLMEMTAETVIYLVLFLTTAQIVALFVLGLTSIVFIAALRYSRKRGRNPKSK